ncbi:hypothetical protein [Bradyrhizobium sp.]|uniref:hypothetical protein n=1 Tax=Bradyrhizobium sp. TaxID=376 RepID=UPI003C401210
MPSATAQHALASTEAGAAQIGHSASPSQAASWLWPRSGRRRNRVGGRISIGNIRGEPLANHAGGEQALDISKAGQIAQKVASSPGSAISSVTSAHDVTRSRPQLAVIILGLKL